MQQTTSELRVFISSTFRDLQQEREYLIKKVFPEIRALCRERGVTFTEIDLRWGLTDEQSALGQTIRICLEEVDRCRPYFIGLIGNAYGWTPDIMDVAMDPVLLANYPWIEEAVLDGVSLTEMEFIHGVFNRSGSDGTTAYFYRRNMNPPQMDDLQKINRLIERTRESGHLMRDFGDTEALGRMVHDDLVAMVGKFWPESMAPTALELERRSHAGFAASRRRAYIVQPEYLKEFVEFVEGKVDRVDGVDRVDRVDRVESVDTSPLTPYSTNSTASTNSALIIHGESGLGKSSLMASLVDQYRRKSPDAFVIDHYVGASHESSTITSVMRHVISEIADRLAIDETIPTQPEQLERDFPNWLFRAGQHALLQGTSLLIFLDALNQLDEGGRRLAWLPKKIPPGIRLIVSTTPGAIYEELHERQWNELQVLSLTDERRRAGIVVRYLAEFHKSTSALQLSRITSDVKARSPLFLRVVAEELRLHGEHETLDQAIDRYVGAADLEEVFQQVLERMEQDYGAELLEVVLSSIWGSRAGLSESELLEVTGRSRLELSMLMFALEYHLIHRNGLLDFFHDYLRNAVERRYLSSQEKVLQVHSRLAHYFATQPASIRTSDELPWQAALAQDKDLLHRAISNVDLFRLLSREATQFELVRYWVILQDHSKIQDLCDSLLELYIDREKENPHGVASFTADLGRFAMLTGNPDVAESYLRRSLDLALGLYGIEDEHTCTAMNLLSSHLRGAGRPDEAIGYMEQVLQIRRRTFGLRDNLVALTLVNLGLLERDRGDLQQAEKHYREALDIRMELFGTDHPSTARVMANLADILSTDRRYDEAEPMARRALATRQRLLGNQHPETGAGFTILSGILEMMGQLDEAVEMGQAGVAIQEQVSGELHPLTMNAITCLASALTESNRYDEARPFLERATAGRRTVLGARHRAVASSLGELGLLCVKQGLLAEAESYFREALSIYSEHHGDRHRNTAHALVNLGFVLIDTGRDEEATFHFERALVIRQHVCGEDHLDTAQVLATLGSLRNRANNPLDAAAYFDRALTILQARLGPEHERTQQVLVLRSQLPIQEK